MKLYEKVATSLIERIEQSFYQVGDKLPSIRVISQTYKVSISTAQEALRYLDDHGWAQSRPKSGYYVLNRQQAPQQLPSVSRPMQMPVAAAKWNDVLSVLNECSSSYMVNMGMATPDVNAPTLQPLTKIIASQSRQFSAERLLGYGRLQGSQELRKQVARIMVDSGCSLHPDDIITTSGCQESLSASIRTVSQDGDVIAVDSPSFYGVTQAIEAHGLKTLEIPTHPETGISLEALELALEQWPIKAIQVTPTCNNPLGYTMPEDNKRRLLALATQYDIPIIEDDIYGDLSFQLPRPRSIKSMDVDGRVIFCSSFSKTLAPGFRLGWVAPGRYLDQMLRMKFVFTNSGSFAEEAVAEFIAQGMYERHLRKMRQQYEASRDKMIGWIEKYFPEGTKISYPKGSFLLWVELDKRIDTIELNQRLREYHVVITPGTLFSASGKYKNCFRINYRDTQPERIEPIMRAMGEQVFELMNMSANPETIANH